MALPQVPLGYNVPASVTLEDFWANPSQYKAPGVEQPGNISPNLLSQAQTSLGTALKGQLPSDVQNLLRQSAAQYGVAAGLPGSQFAGYRGLRNLGLTSLDQINKAQAALTPFMTSPYQSAQLDIQRAGLALNQQQAAREAVMMNRMESDRQAAARREQANAWNNRTLASSSPSVTYGYQPTASYGGGYGGYGGGYQAPAYGAQTYQAPAPAVSSYQPYTWYGGTADEPSYYAGNDFTDQSPYADEYADYGDWGDAYYDWDYS